MDRMDRGRALKGELLMKEKLGNWVPYAQPLLDIIGRTFGVCEAAAGLIRALLALAACTAYT